MPKQPGTTLFALLCALALAACGSSSDQCAAAPDIATATFSTYLYVDLSMSTKTSDGLYFRDIIPGVGAQVTAGQLVSITYTGWLTDGMQFDSNATSATPYSFPLGGTTTIAGFSEGVATMRVGGTRQLIIPPSLAYGANANGSIPCNSILVFNVQLRKAQ